jgi:formylglycine-generating enzyme required for sulfatase activity
MFNLTEPFTWMDIPAGEVEIEDQRFTVPSFQMSRYPITNAQFRAFIEGGGYHHPQFWTEAGWQQKEKESWTEPRYWNDSKWNGADYPIVGVSWFEALAFCQWLGINTGSTISLPTEQQWQRAAQGDDGRLYPWGDDWDVDERSAYCNETIALPWEGHRPSSVHQYEGKGDSPFGVVDMFGNVWEWTLSVYKPTSDAAASDLRVLRGGWHAYAWRTDLTIRWHAAQDFRGGPYGFRLARLR